MWCYLCNEKMINDSIKIKGKEVGVCSHCKSLYVEEG